VLFVALRTTMTIRPDGVIAVEESPSSTTATTQRRPRSAILGSYVFYNLGDKSTARA
jgi:hypothetical protein